MACGHWQPVKFPDKASVTTVPYMFKVSQQAGGAMGFQQIMPCTPVYAKLP